MTNPTPDQAHLLTVGEAADCLGIGRTKTYELVMSGVLPSIKIGARRLISVSSVTAYIREKLGRDERRDLLTKRRLEALVESREVQAITLGEYLFVSVDSLDSYVRRQLGNTDLAQVGTHRDPRSVRQLTGGLDQCHR